MISREGHQNDRSTTLKRLKESSSARLPIAEQQPGGARLLPIGLSLGSRRCSMRQVARPDNVPHQNIEPLF